LSTAVTVGGINILPRITVSGLVPEIVIIGGVLFSFLHEIKNIAAISIDIDATDIIFFMFMC
jgi:hypothetical protein